MKKNILYIIELILIAALTIGVFKFVVIPIRIDGISMENTLYDQDIALVNKWNISEDTINRFDVAVLYSSELDEKIIKRVIGLPGDVIKFENDILYINDQQMDQTFLDPTFVEESKTTYNVSLFTDNFSVTVPDNEYFVMGDNRLRSTDSRELGTFTIDDFIGIEGVVIFPFSHFQWLDKED